MITIRSALPAGKFRTTCHPWLHRGVTYQLERQANLQHPAGCATRPAFNVLKGELDLDGTPKAVVTDAANQLEVPTDDKSLVKIAADCLSELGYDV